MQYNFKWHNILKAFTYIVFKIPTSSTLPVLLILLPIFLLLVPQLLLNLRFVTLVSAILFHLLSFPTLILSISTLLRQGKIVCLVIFMLLCCYMKNKADI